MLQGCNSLVQRHGCHLALRGEGECPRPCRSFRASTIGAATFAESLGSTGGKNAVEPGGIRFEDLFGPVVFHAFL